MKNILFVILLIITACGQEKTSPKNADSTDDDAAVTQVKDQITDSLKVNPSTDFVTGQFDFTSHKDFVKVDSQYVNKEVYLHEKAYQAFKAMADSAQKEGVNFTIISGARNFNYQKSIWDRKWAASDSSTDLARARGILEYSSMPMTSRHHWGTEIDLNDLNNSYFESGQGLKEYEWLKEHANDFGFYQPYTDKSKNGRTGYNEEKWHWSYLPLASQYLKYYNKHVTNADISGFQGSELAPKIDMVKNYVNGISSKMKEKDNRTD